MLGVFNVLSSFFNTLSVIFTFALTLISLLWRFFEQYGWRLLIGFVSAWYFIQRVCSERERRDKIARRAQAADPSRVATLNDRRAATLNELGEQYARSIENKRRRDNELRLRRLRDLEKRIIGSGRRLGSI